MPRGKWILVGRTRALRLPPTSIFLHVRRSRREQRRNTVSLNAVGHRLFIVFFASRRKVRQSQGQEPPLHESGGVGGAATSGGGGAATSGGGEAAVEGEYFYRLGNTALLRYCHRYMRRLKSRCLRRRHSIRTETIRSVNVHFVWIKFIILL